MDHRLIFKYNILSNMFIVSFKVFFVESVVDEPAIVRANVMVRIFIWSVKTFKNSISNITVKLRKP